ncbi:hypothetical protein ACFYXH_41350 [Streptomyces sp. NPDC002730]|uniref:hypothetical protein n=1 Tax=Streptomyces sp. NPDC002730 TaxID=3364662 RepID=UPI00367CDE79
MRGERDGGCAGPVVEHEEAGWFEQRDVGGAAFGLAHARVDERQQDIDERGGGEQAVDEAEDASQPPAAVADGGEDRVVEQGEDQAVDEVRAVAEGLGAGPVASERGAEQERQIDAGEVEGVGRAQAGGQDEGADKPARAAQMLIVWPARSRRRR